jgi:S-adenosylmethionine/arginine decarboxylase-like enzyme
MIGYGTSLWKEIEVNRYHAKIETKPYGMMLVLDMHHCDVSLFKRRHIRGYFHMLCAAIDMVPCKLTWWDDFWTWLIPWRKSETREHTAGTSAVQFILTSNITIHTLRITGRAYIDIFSCKSFDADVAERLTVEWFRGECVNSTLLTRY